MQIVPSAQPATTSVNSSSAENAWAVMPTVAVVVGVVRETEKKVAPHHSGRGTGIPATYVGRQLPFDSAANPSGNCVMGTETTARDVAKVLEETIDRLVQGVRDPATGRKAREEMDRMREETRKRIGTIEAAVDLVCDAPSP